ncbi:MAG TPA: lipase family protein [Caulobacteraceae bacterium]|nr:lipase family protein [Caulobacteraceae bacterium]
MRFSYGKIRRAAAAVMFGLVALTPPTALAQTWPTTLAQAEKLEADDALLLTPFYATPPSLAATKPGALLRQEAFRLYALPPGVRAVRILYHSLNATGGDVATSAVVLIPPGEAPKGGWPIIAWAHGTSGVARQCAPSLMKDVYYGEEGLFPMVRAGYAVVATDYHGLGTEGPHQYVNKIAQAQDVVFSIPAARAAVAALGERWVVDGHSQGGTAAWGVAEMEHDRHDAGYLGAVAVAPASRLDEVLTAPAAAESFYLDYIAWGISARTLSFKPADMLGGRPLASYADLSTKGCFYYAYATFLGDTTPPTLTPGWERTDGAKRFFADTAIGFAPIGGPLLVIAGDADQTVPIAAVHATVAVACARRAALEFRIYPGLDHDPTMDKSTPDQLAWIADRFAGRPAADVCKAPSG